MALFTLISQGSSPVGALLVGRLADHLGARSGLYLGGLASLAAALAALTICAGRRDAPDANLGGQVEPGDVVRQEAAERSV